MTDFNISPEEKMNNYFEFNQSFPVYQANTLDPNTMLQQPIPTQPLNIFGSGPTPVIAKAKTTPKVTKDTNNNKKDDSELSPLEKLRNIYKNVGSTDDVFPSIAQATGYNSSGPVNISELKRQIAKVESEGLGGYNAQNKDSSAVGKYQFLWGRKADTGWGKDIKRVTGISSPEEFRKNPMAQESFFDYYAENTLKPQLATIKKEFPNSGLSDYDIMKGLHFQGLGKSDRSNGLRKVLANNLHTAKMQKNNLSFYDYLKVSNK